LDAATFSQSASYGSGSVGEKLQQIISVKDQPYGAKGDGVTDDTAAITAAFAAIKSAGGGMVLVPTGRYKINSQIVLDEMPVYRVCGASGSVDTVSAQTEIGKSSVFVNNVGGTMFVQKGTTTANHEITSNNLWEHIAFEGYLDNTNNIAFDSQNGYDQTVFRNCAFLGGKYGWTMTSGGTFDIYFEHTHFFNVVTAGCFIPNTAADALNIVWRDCVCRFCGYFIDAQVGDSFYLENCFAEACTSGGIRLDNVFFIHMKGNHFEQNAIGGAGHYDLEILGSVNSNKTLTMIGDTFTFDAAHNQAKQVHITDALKMTFMGVGSNGSGGAAVASFDINTPGGREVIFLECSLATAATVAGATQFYVIPNYVDWTIYNPTITNVTTSAIAGRYMRLGNQVTFKFQVTVSAAPTGNITISLPITASASLPNITVGFASGVVAGVYPAMGAVWLASSTTLQIHSSGAGLEWSAAQPGVWVNGNIFEATVVYQV
jgi:hypothetical protein